MGKFNWARLYSPQDKNCPKKCYWFWISRLTVLWARPILALGKWRTDHVTIWQAVVLFLLFTSIFCSRTVKLPFIVARSVRTVSLPRSRCSCSLLPRVRWRWGGRRRRRRWRRTRRSGRTWQFLNFLECFLNGKWQIVEGKIFRVLLIQKNFLGAILLVLLEGNE